MTDPGRPTIESPKPTVWPLVVALGLALAGAGVAVGTVAFLAVGGLFFVVAVWNWLAELLPGRGTEAEPTAGPTPAPVAGRTGAVEPMRPGTEGYRFRLPEKVHPIRAGLKGGAAGGVAMPVPALLWGVLSGHGVWFPVNLLAGLALPGIDELSVAELEQFRPTLFAVGVVIHATISAVVGLVYGVLLPTIPRSPRWQLVTGGVVLPLIWTGASYGLMGVANPVLRQYVDWAWFAVSQFVFGLVAAAVVVRSEKVIVPPAGTGRPSPPPTEGGRP